MKPLLIAAALLLAPAAAQAQVAAGTVPNTFDQPARASTPVPAPAQPATPAAPETLTPANPQSEDVLRAIIESARAGALDYGLMTDDLAGQVRAQDSAVTPLIQSFGEIQAVDFIRTQEEADLFVVVFANAETHWVIGFNDAGKVDALLFRPAPEPGVAPAD